MMNSIRGYILLYRLSNGPKDFVLSCFVNRWFNPFRYHMCDYCEHISVKHPVIAGIWYKIAHKPWYCNKCSHTLKHTQSCHRAYCIECDMAHRYLARENTKGTATRLLREAGFHRIVMFGPND